MPRILAIDYGTKRTGLAVTDPLQIIANGLDTVPTSELADFLKRYMEKEEVEAIVVGEPLYPDGNPAQIHHLVVGLVRQLRKLFPDIEVLTHDERFTSEQAKEIILQSGAGKKKRRDKSLVDKISAVLILQDYMESKRNFSEK
ncbi:MAG: Holliday junction resolvase RuvX [Phaeodactylibacter sp.]|nr:Holliday junction resolvase RuvX [Phaeodactylibacter sp.]MCB9302810.1 Holliday junction resolvase RuvX [Lewinellaceae bacterium]